jgi:hypothetical protein
MKLVRFVLWLFLQPIRAFVRWAGTDDVVMMCFIACALVSLWAVGTGGYVLIHGMLQHPSLWWCTLGFEAGLILTYWRTFHACLSYVLRHRIKSELRMALRGMSAISAWMWAGVGLVRLSIHWPATYHPHLLGGVGYGVALISAGTPFVFRQWKTYQLTGGLTPPESESVTAPEASEPREPLTALPLEF